MKLREESGIDVKIRLCDTMGYGVTYPGAALPRSVDKPRSTPFINDAGVSQPSSWNGTAITIFHKGMINATTAWLYGCKRGKIQHFLGLGEKNRKILLLKVLILNISRFKGNNGIDTTVITDIAEYFEKEIGVKIPHNYPFVGLGFNVNQPPVFMLTALSNAKKFIIYSDNQKKF